MNLSHSTFGVFAIACALLSGLPPSLAAEFDPRASVYCNQNSNGYREPIDKLLRSLSFEDPRVKSASTFQDCTQAEVKNLKAGEVRALKLLPLWNAKLKDHFNSLSLKGEQSRQTTRAASGTARTLGCVERILGGGVHYKCNAREVGDDLAWVFPLFGKTIKVSKHFFNESPEHVSGVIIHEITHKCGLNDAAYFNLKHRAPRSTKFAHWSSIADTYEYWAEFGFCIPEETCPR